MATPDTIALDPRVLSSSSAPQWFTPSNPVFDGGREYFSIRPISTGVHAETVYRSGLTKLEFVVTAGKTYPKWLNLIAWPIFALFPIEIIFLFTNYHIIGLAIVGVGFLSIWIFGNLAHRLGRQQRMVMESARDSGIS